MYHFCFVSLLGIHTSILFILHDSLILIYLHASQISEDLNQKLDLKSTPQEKHIHTIKIH